MGITHLTHLWPNPPICHPFHWQSQHFSFEIPIKINKIHMRLSWRNQNLYTHIYKWSRVVPCLQKHTFGMQKKEHQAMSLPLIIQCISVFVVSFLPHLSFQTETALVAPVYKHNSTDPILFQYIVQVYLKTPLQSNKLLLDLAHPFSYMECNADYNSSTYQHIPCDASLWECWPN